MEWNHIDWEVHSGLVQSHWDKFTSADIQHIAGIRSALVEKIIEYYGVSETEAEEEISDFLDSIDRPAENSL